MLQQVGKMVVVVGLALAALGGLMILFARLGLGRLPGDLAFGGRHWGVFIPIGTCILLSALLTLILYLLSRLRQ